MSNPIGIFVIDMSHAVAGPTAGAILADLGASVLKVEHPHGDHFRPLLDGAYFAAANRNKRGIALDLKQPEGRQVVERLVERADVLLESFIPGAMERLGLGYEAVSRRNPRLIYCSISGFGQEGPYSGLPGYDVVAQAMSGIVACTGMPDGPPVRIGASWIDAGAGMYTVIGILKALFDRERTGRGKRIDVSLLDTALSWMAPQIAHHSMTGRLPGRVGSALAAASPYQFFECADGHVFIGASTEKFWQTLCRLLGLDHLPEDPRFATNADRIANREALTKLIESALADIPRDRIVEQLREAGIPCGPILDVGQIVGDEHVRQRGVLHAWDHPEFGPLTQVKTPIRDADGMPGIETPSPRLGQHSRTVLEGLGYSREEIEGLIERKVVVAQER